MKQNINEHDMTKKMMDIMRGGFKKLLKEDSAGEYDDDYVVEILPNSAEYNKQLQELQTIDVTGKIESFKIYPNQQKAILKGTYFSNSDTADGVDNFNDTSVPVDYQNGEPENENNFSGIKFTFMTNNQQPKAKMNDVTVQPDFWTKFDGLFKTWSEEWIVKLGTEYKPKADGL